MKTVGIMLSGCGVYDGSEIHETTLCAYFLDKQSDIQVTFYAPDMAQHDTINHATGDAQTEKRNCLTEAARIARGHISPLSEHPETTCDALIFPIYPKILEATLP